MARDAYLEAALEKECATLRATTDHRNKALNRAAFRMGQLTYEGMTWQRAYDALMAATTLNQTEEERAEAEEVFDRAYRKGTENPRVVAKGDLEELHCTLHWSVKLRKGKRISLTWDKCRSIVENPHAVGKRVEGSTVSAPVSLSDRNAKTSTIPVLIFALFPGDSSADRTDPEACTALGLDWDKDPGISIEKVRERVGRYRFFAYSTGSSSPEQRRYRAFLPYSRAVSPSEHRQIAEWANWQGRWGVLDHAAGKDPKRCWFVPVDNGHYECDADTRAPLLNPDACLAELREWKAQEKQEPETTEPAKEEEKQEQIQIHSFGEVLHPHMEDLARRERGEVKPIPLPWENVSYALSARGGLWPGNYVLVGGTGTGKTQFVLQVALHAAKMGQPVWYLHLEMPAQMVTARVVGLHLAKPWSRIMEGLTKPAPPGDYPDWWSSVKARHHRELEQLEELPLKVSRGKGGEFTYQDVEQVVYWMEATYSRPPLIIVDYLQCLGSALPETPYERLSSAARAIENAVAKVNGTALVVSSSARDNNEVLQGRKNASLGELVKLGRGSGEIEYSADSLIVLLNNEPEGWKGATPIEVCFPKMRSASTCTVPLMFDGLRGVHREPTEKEREELLAARSAVQKQSKPPELEGGLDLVIPRIRAMTADRAREVLPYATRVSSRAELQKVIAKAEAEDPDPFGHLSR